MATATDVSELLATHPRPSEVDREALARCIAECYDCARSCTICADADLAEEDVADDAAVHSPLPGLRRRLHRDRTHGQPPDGIRAGDRAGGRSRAAGNPARPAPRSASAMPQHHEHCRLCAESCRRCEAACAALLDAI